MEDNIDHKLGRLRLELRNLVALRKDAVTAAELEQLQQEVVAIETAIHALVDRIAELERRPATIKEVSGGTAVIVQPGNSYMPAGW